MLWNGPPAHAQHSDLCQRESGDAFGGVAAGGGVVFPSEAVG